MDLYFFTRGGIYRKHHTAQAHRRCSKAANQVLFYHFFGDLCWGGGGSMNEDGGVDRGYYATYLLRSCAISREHGGRSRPPSTHSICHKYFSCRKKNVIITAYHSSASVFGCHSRGCVGSFEFRISVLYAMPPTFLQPMTLLLPLFHGDRWPIARSWIDFVERATSAAKPCPWTPLFPKEQHISSCDY